MIRYLARKELDVDKYDKCICQGLSAHIYAYTWYLDSVADNWDALVLDDYKAVMPIPWRKKYFVKYIYLPAWVQQLGVFTKEHCPRELVQLFINSIPAKFKYVETHLNSNNKFESTYISIRSNFILPLNKSYNELVKNYKKGRKSDIKNAKKYELEIKETNDATQIITLFMQQKGDEVRRKPSDYERLKDLTKELILHEKIFIAEVYHKENILIGGAIFLIDPKRITYLFSVSTDKGREKNVISLLIDSVIEKYANSKRIFDFEGSMIPGLASFFRSFGATKEEYYHYKKYRL